LKNGNDVILVDRNDRELGSMEKMEAHIKGELHRAFSVFVFNEKNELLLQRRAFGKYHSEGLWTNTCCSHPAPGESISDAGKRRMKEEMGMDIDPQPLFSFIYRAELDNSLIEHELDHVLVAFCDETPHLNPEEAIAFKWMSLDDIKKDMQVHSESYTEWFKIIIEQHLNEFSEIFTHESL
jgi:isopentenyl-diphosphate Delta-isomerase